MKNILMHQSRLIMKVDTLYDKYYIKKKEELIIHEIHSQKYSTNNK